jgi:signal transduction histidine kinase
MGLVTRESERLNRIITDFLQYARIRPADKAVIDVGKVVEETLILVRNHDAFHDNIEVVNEVQNRGVHVLADQDQVRQIFLNVAINALQAMPHGGCLTVGLVDEGSNARAQGKNEMVGVFFRDTGVGISPQEIENIFEPFYSAKKGGTGLGLSIAQRIVENNGGTLEVESQVNRGTTFTVSLMATGKHSEDEDGTA